MPLKTSKAKKAAPAMVKGGNKKGKKPVPVPEPEEESSEEEDMSDSSEETAPVPVTKGAKKIAVAANSDGDSDEDEDESEEEDDSEEEPAPVVKSKKGAAVNGVKQKAAAEESDDDDDDEEESEEEEAPPPKGKKAGKAAKAPVMEVDEDDSDEDDEEGSDDEEESDEEEEEPVQKKRKAPAADKVPAKKAKVDASAPQVVSLYVANLAEDIEESKIRKFFKKNGISVSEVRHKAPKAFCYVDLEDADDLDKALALAGQKLKGQEVKIEQAKQRNEPKTAEKKTPQKDDAQTPNKRADDNCLLFVKNLPEDVTKEMLEEVFDNAKDVRLPLNAEGGFRGFAFVEFHAEADVDTAMEDKQGTDVGGRSIFLDYTGSKSKGVKKAGSFGGAPQQRKSFGEAGKTKVLFVKNLSFNLTKESLAEAFDGATTARIATFPDTGKPRGFGFVEFDSPADATAAFDSMNGTELDGRELKLDYATENQNSPGGRGGGRGGRGGFDRGGRGGGFRGGRGFGGGRGRGGGDRGGRGRGGFRGGTRGSGSRKTFDD